MRRLLISVGLVAAVAAVAAVVSWLIWPLHFVLGPYGAAVPAERAEYRYVEPHNDGYDDRQGEVAFGELTVSAIRPGDLSARRADGSIYWKYHRLLPPEMPSWAAVSERLVVVVWCDDWMVAFDVPAGEMVWSAKLPPGPKDAYCVGGVDDQKFHLWGVYTDPAGQIFEVSRFRQRVRIDVATGRVLGYGPILKPLSAGS
ncbi:hypothetical protein [Nonomuraea sp. LPB2021202275-12-8]|uniref:hypothetical protein n=1 Tax=Nonomuraea sp. LPB2021202275-12-8 TaxID=3120159 RepID=UPI00300C4C68